MIYTVDRIEGAFAVLEAENGAVRDLPLTDLPKGTEEGDKLEQTEAGWQLRPDLKAAALARSRVLLERLKKQK